MNRIYPALIVCGAVLISNSGANAFSCPQQWSDGSCGFYTFDPGNRTATSFETTHSWKVASPGTLKLSETKFAIVLVEATLTYSLRYRDKELSVHQTLRAAEEQGVTRARELQEMGMPLD